MPITLTCPSCGQQCAVKEEYAGMQVRCPRCPGVITVPAAVMAAVIAEPEPIAAVLVTSAPPMPQVPAGPGFMDNIAKFLAANGISGVNYILLLVGLGSMTFFLITVLFFPWVGGGSVAGISIPSLWGIQTGIGIVEFLLVLAMLFLIVFVVATGWARLLDYCLWTASNMTLFISLHLLGMLGMFGRATGWGMIVSLIVILAAAGTLGVVACSKVFTSKPPSI